MENEKVFCLFHYPSCSVASAVTQAVFVMQSWEAVKYGLWVDGHRFSLSLWQASSAALLSRRIWGHTPHLRRRQHCPLQFKPARLVGLLGLSGAVELMVGTVNRTVHNLQALRKHTATCWWGGADRVSNIPILSLMERLNPKKKAKYLHSSMPQIPLCKQS